MQLDQKERSLLKDLTDQEQICVDKYNKYAAEACDTQLKDLFTRLASNENTHLQTLNQISSGTAPQMGGQSGGQQQPTFTPSSCGAQQKKNDAYLCTDALSTEKHVSAEYNTSIFEFRDQSVRDALNHIQKEEQEHGKQIYDYLAANGMYN